MEVHLLSVFRSAMENDMETIVMIEDNEQNLYMMRYLLEASGFNVLEARDGKSGILLLDTIQPPSAILLDIQLPGMDGYAVAKELRKDEKLADVPIIAVTSYAMVGDREKALAAGATGYIEKPIDPNTFVNQIRNYINERST